jgi:hypothetical protein
LDLRDKILKQHTKCGMCKGLLHEEKYIYIRRSNGDMNSVNNYHVLCSKCDALIKRSKRCDGYREHNTLGLEHNE